jgi:hypothetical protein
MAWRFRTCYLGAKNSRERITRQTIPLSLNSILDNRKGLIGWVCLSVRLSVTLLLQRVQNHMSKRNEGTQPERRNASHALLYRVL